MLKIQPGWKVFFRPFSSKVGDYDCIEMKTLFLKILSCHCSLFQKESGLGK